MSPAQFIEKYGRSASFDLAGLFIVYHELSGAPVAGCFAWRESELPLVGKLHWLGVHPAHQSRGLARFLALRVIDFWRSRGAKLVVLSTEGDREAAIRLYESLGFARVVVAGELV